LADQGQQIALPGDMRRGVLLGANPFDGFEQSRSSAVCRRQRNGGFGDRLRIVRDHRGAAAERKRTVVKNDLRFSDLNAAAETESERSFNYGAVIKRAIR